MNVTYDKDGDAAYISLSKTKITKTKPISDDIIIDLDNKNTIVGIEILRASVQLDKKYLKNDS